MISPAFVALVMFTPNVSSARMVAWLHPSTVPTSSSRRSGRLSRRIAHTATITTAATMKRAARMAKTASPKYARLECQTY